MLILIQRTFGPDVVITHDLDVKQPWVEVAPERLPELCRWLHDTPTLHIDFLHAISGVDEGPEKQTLLVVYHLSSLIHEHQLVIKVRVPRCEDPRSATVKVPSVSGIWKAADWHEREAYDLVGIPFSGHPDLRRMLLPEDWVGHPLRKDYRTDETYHGIEIDY